MPGGTRRAGWHPWAGRPLDRPVDAPMLSGQKLDQHLTAAIDEFSKPQDFSRPNRESQAAMDTKPPEETKRPLQIRRPMELAGLKSRLLRATKQEADIAVTGRRYDKVMDDIADLHAASQGHVGGLEQYAGDLKSTIERMVGGSNGDPNEDGQDGQGSA